MTKVGSAWQVNTDLLPFDLEEVKKDVETGNQGKRNKALWEAYQIAAEGHDLAYFKEMLSAHESAMQEDLEQKEQKEQQKKEKAEKASRRKSTAAATSETADVEDTGDVAASAKKTKTAKKRKNDGESDGESGKVCITCMNRFATTNLATVRKDSEDQAQADDKDTKRGICCKDEERAQVKEESQRGG